MAGPWLESEDTKDTGERSLSFRIGAPLPASVWQAAHPFFVKVTYYCQRGIQDPSYAELGFRHDIDLLEDLERRDETHYDYKDHRRF